MEIEKNYTILQACRFCLMCRHLCTSGSMTSHESDFPRGRGLILHKISKGEKYNKDYVNSIYNCTLCGCCLAGCEGNFNLPKLIKSARQDIVNQGLEPEIANKMRQSIIKNNNSYFIEKRKSFSNTRGYSSGDKAENLYLLGQDINYINHEIADAVTALFTALKLNFSILNDETDCGKVLSLLGFEEDAKEKAKILYEKILNSGCSRLIISDPLTYDCIKNDYPDWGFEIAPEVEILHISQFINGQIKNGLLKLRKSDKKVMLADSEYLGKINGIFDEPRKVLLEIANSGLVEPLLNKKQAFATGEAAFVFNGKAFPYGNIIWQKICREAKRIGAQTIITLSAQAKRNLVGCENEGIEVKELSEFVIDYL